MKLKTMWNWKTIGTENFTWKLYGTENYLELKTIWNWKLIGTENDLELKPVGNLIIFGTENYIEQKTLWNWKLWHYGGLKLYLKLWGTETLILKLYLKLCGTETLDETMWNWKLSENYIWKLFRTENYIEL